SLCSTRSTSRLAVRMPDGDFFWNAWRTYNAFSNRTVYTARYAFPSCDSTISSTPGPRPFHGFAVGAVPPNCAMPRAFPMSSFTVAGKLKKSRLADPTQCNGFSSEAETRRTSRLSLFWDIQASGAVFMDILEFRARVLVISVGTGKTGEQPRGVRGHACHFLN